MQIRWKIAVRTRCNGHYRTRSTLSSTFIILGTRTCDIRAESVFYGQFYPESNLTHLCSFRASSIAAQGASSLVHAAETRLALRKCLYVAEYKPITLEEAVSRCLSKTAFSLNNTTGNCHMFETFSAIPVPEKAPQGTLGHFTVDLRSCNGLVAASDPSLPQFFGPFPLAVRSGTPDFQAAQEVRET